MTNNVSQPPWLRTMTTVAMFIGFTANEWNKLENRMVLLAACLMRADYRVAEITMNALPPVGRRDYLAALAASDPWKGLPIRAAVDTYLTEFERLRKLRNDIVHGRWDFSHRDPSEDTQPIVTILRRRADPTEDVTPRDTQFILDAVADIQVLQGRTVDLSRQLKELFLPSQQKSP
jgi:hypothetical protein